MADPTLSRMIWCSRGALCRCCARPGGVLQRAGHTEAAVDLVVAGCRPIAVICEIMSDDGSMYPPAQLRKFAKKHRLKICTIADLIEYRRTREKTRRTGEVVKLPTDYGDFDLHRYRSMTRATSPTLVSGNRWQSDARARLANTLPAMSSARAGVIAARNSSRRCGRFPKPAPACWFTCGRKVVALASRRKSRPTNCRSRVTTPSRQTKNSVSTTGPALSTGLGAQILVDLGVKTIRLLTNNPKVVGLEGYGLKIVEQVPIRVKPNAHNERYLKTKREKMGHLL